MTESADVLSSLHRVTLAVLASTGLALCLLMASWKLGDGSDIAGCAAGSSCHRIMATRWSEVLHVPVSVPAAFLYLAIFASLWKPRRDVFIFLALCLAAAAGWFLLIQALVIKSFCPWCAAAHACGLVTAGTLLVASRSLSAKPLAPPAILAAGAMFAFAIAQVLGPAPQGFRVDAVAESNRPASPAGTNLFPAGIDRDSDSLLPRRGRPGTPHRLVMLFDYTCPSCRTLQSHLDDLLAAYPASVEVVFLPTPLDPALNPHLPPGVAAQPHSGELARLALAAWILDPDRFRETHDILFANSSNPAGATDQLASMFGSAALERTLKDSRIDRTLLANAQDYRLLSNKINALPKLVIDGKRIVHGAPPGRDVFFNALRREIGL